MSQAFGMPFSIKKEYSTVKPILFRFTAFLFATILFICVLISCKIDININTNSKFTEEKQKTETQESLTETESTTEANIDFPTDRKIIYTELAVLPWDEGADISVYRGNLILVNEAHSYHYPETRIEDMSENEKNAYSLMTYRVMVGNTFPYYVLPNSKNFYMIPEAAKAMGDLLTYHYNQTEEQLLVRAGYQQESSVTNGNYDQQVGLSASIDNDMDVSLKSDTCQKLISEGVKFGIIQRFPNGKASETGASGCTNVFRYVGVPHAGYITSQGITLEAYLSLLQSDYTYSKSHLLLNAEGEAVKAKDAVYEVYYVEATADGTMSVPVPKNYRYTISGDNMKGFIVTVNLNKPIA